MKAPLKNNKNPAQPIPAKQPGTGASPWRWIAILAALVGTAVGSWAVMEFVVWNRLPSELVGRWEVVEGPPEYSEAVFEFFRSGALVGRLNDNGNLRIMNASVRLEDDKLYVTTRRPSTGEEHVSVQTVKTLSEREFVVADSRGKIMRMLRLR